MRYAWLVIAIFAARFLVTAIAYPALDGDLGWQRRLGEQVLASGAIPRALGSETFTAPGAAWTPQEWLFGTIVALAARVPWGWNAFAVLVALGAVAALALAAWHARRRGGSERAVALCTAFAGVALFESFGVRAQVLAWPLLATFALLLDAGAPLLWLCVPLAALWSNVHASALLAPVLAAAAALGAWLDARRFSPRARQLTLLAAACTVAVCANPFGWHLPAYALTLMGSPIKANISEWKVTDVDDTSFAFGALALLLGAVVLGLRRPPQARWGDVLTFGAFAWLLLSAARNVPLFALVALPLVAEALTARLPLFARTNESPRSDVIGRFVMPGVSLALATLVAIVLFSDGARADDRLASRALAALRAQPGQHDVLCADFAWCGLLADASNVRVFLDGRADPYPRDVWHDFVTIVRLHEGWRARLDARGVDAVVVERDAPLDQALTRLRDWRVAFADRRYRLWLRASDNGAQSSSRRAAYSRACRACPASAWYSLRRSSTAT